MSLLISVTCRPSFVIPNQYSANTVNMRVLVLLIFVTQLLQRFAAVIMRIREPKTTALIFASGKMVCFFVALATSVI